MKDKRKIVKLFGLFIIIFAVLLLLTEIAVAVINNVLTTQEAGAYAVTLVIMPSVALVLTGVIVWIVASMYKNVDTLVEGLDRVANGDFKVQLDVKRSNSYSKICENFNKMTKELNSVNTLREDFVRDISHEIKTPLCSINGFANLLLEGGIPQDEQTKYLKIIADEADKLRRFTEGILTLSKLENQQIIRSAAPVRLDVQIRECVVMLQRDWEKKNLNVNLDLQPSVVHTDETLLGNVWSNLLSNAIKFTPAGGEINVTLKKEGGEAVVIVNDSGSGIPEEDIPRVFEKFYRSSTAKKTEGNGIGLAICKRICTLLNGDISCVKAEKGAAFKVVLPL